MQISELIISYRGYIEVICLLKINAKVAHLSKTEPCVSKLNLFTNHAYKMKALIALFSSFDVADAFCNNMNDLTLFTKK